VRGRCESAVQAAAELGVTPDAVRLRCRKHGIALPGPGRGRVDKARGRGHQVEASGAAVRPDALVAASPQAAAAHGQTEPAWTSLHEEIQAMGAICGALDGLASEESRRRVLAYVGAGVGLKVG
jgi:hypothetical protein